MPLPTEVLVPEERQADWPPFSSDAMLTVIRDVYRPGWRTGFVTCDGQTFRTLVSPSGRPLTGLWEFPLFLEPIDSRTPARAVPYLDSVCRGVTDATARARPGLAAAPFVDWTSLRSSSWEDYVASRRHAPGTDGFETIRRKERALARDIGEVVVCFDDRDPVVLETLIGWKSAQYRRTGVIDRFARQRNREFYGEMAGRGMLEVASLRAGGKLLAAHAGNRIGGRFLYRLPAFDPTFGRYSPGSLLTLRLLRRSFELGDREFDFLLGDEPYKFTYATHVRWVGPLGREPAVQKALRQTRKAVGSLAGDSAWYRTLRNAADQAVRWSRR